MRATAAFVLVVLLSAGCLATPGTSPANSPATSAVGGDCLGAVGGLDLQNATIGQLEGALANRTITSVQLVDAYEARIHAFDDKTNAVQTLDPHARDLAAQMDAERAAGHLRGPLHGIPILVKDNVGTNWMPTTAGSIALANNTPPKNATLTDKLAAAGAIVLGKAKMSEFAQWISLNNPNGYSSLGGQVHNAYNGGDPSGSSSGSGVAGSMAYAAATIGTETQGSILGPSDANSLVGVKPTLGLVSRAGVIPLAADFDTPGPMARNVEDAARVLNAIAGPDPEDAATAASASHVTDFTAGLTLDALKGKRVGYDANYQSDAIFAKALDDIKKAGATLVPIQSSAGAPNAGTTGADQWGTSELGVIPNEFKQGINDYLAHEAGPGLPVKTLADIIAYNSQHPDQVKYGQDLLQASDATPGDPTLSMATGLAAQKAAQQYDDGLFAKDSLDVIVGPSLSYYQTGAEAGYPTVIVPAGYNGHNPEGVSFFGPAWSEAKLLGYAYAYEQQSHRRLPPTTVTPGLLDGVCKAGAPVPADGSVTPAFARP
ncbi:MAG: amidase [Thermoplasmata archaeon]|jgi:amidase|nr:amidase [Thermoplasmata archaeon]